MNPYREFIEAFAALKAGGRHLPLGGQPPLPPIPIDPQAPRALIFSPHPDDECIVGGWAFRLMRQSGYRIRNVAVTQGSNPARKAERLQELQAACRYLGLELITTAPGGLDQINPKAREEDPARWKSSVQIIARILESEAPRVIFFPHERDRNSTHVGTYWLVRDALATLPAAFTTLVVLTEFWGAMEHPNVMVELSSTDLADLVAALSFHAGEVKRNPYHLTVPAWMQDNVRRGGELVGGQGGAAPDFTFATLYRLQRWSAGEMNQVLDRGQFIAAAENASDLLARLL